RRHTIFSRDWSSDVCSSDLEQYYQPQFFGEERYISTESAKAQRVLKGLEKHTSSAQVGQVWRAFLSEDTLVQQAIFDVAIEIFQIGRASCRERVEVSVDGCG